MSHVELKLLLKIIIRNIILTNVIIYLIAQTVMKAGKFEATVEFEAHYNLTHNIIIWLYYHYGFDLLGEIKESKWKIRRRVCYTVYTVPLKSNLIILTKQRNTISSD